MSLPLVAVNVALFENKVFTDITKLRCLVLVLQSCLTLCNPMDHSPSGCSVHGILQARILEWVAIPFSRDLPNSWNPGLSHAISLPSEPIGHRKKIIIHGPGFAFCVKSWRVRMGESSWGNFKQDAFGNSSWLSVAF